ncbi:hypothetical protein EYB53_003195 [Candidatus Chloroploca sp. M-50]|uniref:Uncharacterized protein n=1 Tax=Candidatus Chloroploca mongolica TaxID=2528176 RepID=A0ABS4D5L1_9CHLR|nr:hypothetical protein [Candidatus Chloroploca mongolica]MBP1464709.1 hypothetical protein [Candidatus Chloroploca mongolica]
MTNAKSFFSGDVICYNTYVGERRKQKSILIHSAYIAIFVGEISDENSSLLEAVRILVEFKIIEDSKEAYYQVTEKMPDYVILPLTHSDTHILRLFHELRMNGRTCVIVWGEENLTAFNGRGYRWRRSANKNAAGLDSLLVWGKWPLAVRYKRSQESLRQPTISSHAKTSAEPAATSTELAAHVSSH